MDYTKLKTKCGSIKGLSFEQYSEFRGIKYANAKRWEYPTVISKWDKEYDATQFGDCSYQHRGFEDDVKCNPFYHKEFREGMQFTYSEDCQYLNIYAPKDGKDHPVIIFIHGGSFTGGSSNEGHINGTNYAKLGIVFVTINYRLGAFGFCSHPDLTNDDGICGNFGLYDQYSAIKWVKDNINEFGGDSNKITLMGQSAGAMSVDIQLSNPLCKGWFQGAILMSGAGIQRSVAKPINPEKTREFWNTIIKNAGVKDIMELREVDVKTLYFAWKDACKSDKMSMLYTLPVNDGMLTTKGNFNMDTIPSIPKILGITTMDMVPEVLKGLTKNWVKHDKAPCYLYTFARDLPGDDRGAWHACDLLYAFGTIENNWRPYEKIDYEISNQMIKAFTAFAKSGNPNCNAIPSKWTPGASKVMTFCENTQLKKWQTGKLIKNTLNNKGW